MHIIQMQRRPLEKIQHPSILDDMGNLEALAARVFDYMDVDKPHLACSLFCYASFTEAFQSIGFTGSPVKPTVNFNKSKNPIKPPSADHPKFFLQWGAEAVTENYCYCDIGDFRKLIRFDFRVNKIDRQEFVQLDQIQFVSGNDAIAIKCDVPNNHNTITNLHLQIAQTVQNLNLDNTDVAKHHFDQIQWPSVAVNQSHRLIAK